MSVAASSRRTARPFRVASKLAAEVFVSTGPARRVAVRALRGDWDAGYPCPQIEFRQQRRTPGTDQWHGCPAGFYVRVDRLDDLRAALEEIARVAAELQAEERAWRTRAPNERWGTA